jgi:hypothetical protein
MLLMQSFAALGIQLINIGSAALFFLNAVPVLAALLLNPLLSSNPNEISMATYFLGQIFPLLTSSLLTIPTLEVFVPLVSIPRLSLTSSSDTPNRQGELVVTHLPIT